MHRLHDADAWTDEQAAAFIPAPLQAAAHSLLLLWRTLTIGAAIREFYVWYRAEFSRPPDQQHYGPLALWSDGTYGYEGPHTLGGGDNAYSYGATHGCDALFVVWHSDDGLEDLTYADVLDGIRAGARSVLREMLVEAPLRAATGRLRSLMSSTQRARER